MSVRTANDGAVFWSGKNMMRAQQWAATRGKTTLEQTQGGKWLHGLNLFKTDGKGLLGPSGRGTVGGDRSAQIWDIASKRFSKQASGETNAILTGTNPLKDAGRAYYKTEKPLLMQNKNVTKIIEHR